MTKREEILAAAVLKTDTIEIPGGIKVTVRELLAGERTEFMEIARTDPGSIPSFLTRRVCVDDNGAAVFSDEDTEALRKSSPQVLDVIGSAALKLSGMGGEKEKPKPGEAKA